MTNQYTVNNPVDAYLALHKVCEYIDNNYSNDDLKSFHSLSHARRAIIMSMECISDAFPEVVDSYFNIIDNDEELNDNKLTLDQFNELVSNKFSLLPSTITKENMHLFIDAFNYVDHLCADKSLFRLLIPFHHLTFGLANVNTDGFTWEEFLKDAIDGNYIHIDIDNSTSCQSVYFSNEDNHTGFAVCVEHDD